MVEQDPVKIKVRGSNPRGGAKVDYHCDLISHQRVFELVTVIKNDLPENES